MFDAATILKRASEKGNFTRTRYEERKIPISFSDVTVMSFFGDIRSSFVLSSLLLNRYREEVKGSKYFVLLTWPGHEVLYPYVDEIWTIQDESTLIKLNSETKGFDNLSGINVLMTRQLNKFFDDVVEVESLKNFYDKGIKEHFFERFRHVKCFLPSVPSAVTTGTDFIKDLGRRDGFKVFIYPSKFVAGWRANEEYKIRVPLDFWVGLCEELAEKGFHPVVYRDYSTYDLSIELPNCTHYREWNLGKALAAMRATGCVLDIFSGISRFAIAARCPYVLYEDRAKYVGLKEYEIDDLCSIGLPKQSIFGFSTIINGGNKSIWKQNVYDAIVSKLNVFLPTLDRDTWPSTSESNAIVPYAIVRKIKTKRFGTRFIKVHKD